MVHVDPETGTAFLNAATVPRVRPAGGGGEGSGGGAAAAAATLRHFLVFDLVGGAVESARDVWVRVAAGGGAGGSGGSGGEQVAAPKRQAAGSGSSSSSGNGGCGGGGNGSGNGGGNGGGPVAVVEEEREVLRTVRGDGGGVVRMAWDAHRQEWDAVVVAPRRGADSSGGESDGGVAAAVDGERCAVAAVCAPEV
jgi:hypothetical protein